MVCKTCLVARQKIKQNKTKQKYKQNKTKKKIPFCFQETYLSKIALYLPSAIKCNPGKDFD